MSADRNNYEIPITAKTIEHFEHIQKELKLLGDSACTHAVSAEMDLVSNKVKVNYDLKYLKEKKTNIYLPGDVSSVETDGKEAEVVYDKYRLCFYNINTQIKFVFGVKVW